MNIHADFIEGCKKDAYEYYFEEYDRVPTYFDKVAEERSSDAAYEKGTVITGPGTLDEKPYGGDYKAIGLSEAFTWYAKMREYGNLLPIEGSTLEDIKRKAGDLIKQWSKYWAEAARNTKEILVFNIFNYGGYTSGHAATFNQSIPGGVLDDPSGDGVYTGTAAAVKPFICLSGNEWTDPNGDTYYNGLSLDPSPENFKTAYELLTRTNAKTESGAVAVIIPDTLLCANSKDALLWKQILQSEKLAGTNLNDVNVLRNLVNNIIDCPFLNDAFASARAWALMQSKKSIMIFHRIEPEFDFFEDKKSNTFYGRIRMRIGATVRNVKYTVGSNFPTS
ncbi:MAG: hypothetical protein DRJ60_02325 [Thermoprotei archaeon]|nr:MAG: hypothetical protein DRJ60_02325 [Thermoprotei archaeon]